MYERRSPLGALASIVAALAIAFTAIPTSAATDVLNPAWFDPSVKPTNNFYQYAVGGWIRANPIPPDRTSWNSFEEVDQRNELRVRQILESPEVTLANVGTERRKIGDFYAACTDTDGIEASGTAALKPMLSAIASLRSADGIAAIVAEQNARGYSGNVGFAFGSEQDPKAATRVIAALGQGGLTLPTPEYYTDKDARSRAIRASYVKLLTRDFTLLGDSTAMAGTEAANVLGVETALARVSKSPDALRDPFANYHPMPLGSLRSLAPGFAWSTYFSTLGVTDAQLAKIDVGQPEFTTAFAKLTHALALDSWRSYLRWHTLDSVSTALPKAFRDAGFAFSHDVYGQAKQTPRKRTCDYATDGALGFAVGKIYVAKYFPPAARARARREIAGIRAALKSDIETISWMGPKTRAAALKKLAKLSTIKVGYPDHPRDYSTLHVDRSDFLRDELASATFERRLDLAKIGKPVDRTDWGLTPQTVNAYYDPAMNEIVIPAGILEKPFFDEAADDAVNFGGIGVVIGHEMTHGYDDQGSDYDGNGNLNPIVTKADAARYQKRVACIVHQADTFKTAVGLPLNGKLVSGEATADLGGLALAYRAMETQFAAHGRPDSLGGFTPEQRYFLSFAQVWRDNERLKAERAQVLADPHPVSIYRTNGTVSDSQNFDRAFDVKPGDGMYRAPAQQCGVW
jgi:predicted metalloendopeptidase